MYPRIELASAELTEPELKARLGRIVDGEFFRMLPHTVSFFVIRHGQSEGNARRIYQGRMEFPLDQQGRAQAASAGEWLAARKPEVLLCSPQIRAYETARIIGAQCGLEPERIESLAEVDTGIFSGLDVEEAKRAHPGVAAEFFHKSWDAVPGAEHSSRMYARAVDSWTALRERALSGARSVACVSHGGLIQWMLRSTFGARSWLPLFPTSNCGISELLVEPAGHGGPAFMQWSLLNFRAPRSGEATSPVF